MRRKSSKTGENIQRPQTVKERILSDRRLTIREIASDFGLEFGAVQSILTEDSGMRRVSAKFIAKLLSDEQRVSRVQVCMTCWKPAERIQILFGTSLRVTKSGCVDMI